MTEGTGRFDYIQYDNQAKETQAAFKEIFEKLEFMVNGQLPKGLYQSLVFTALEEAFCWLGKAIRDDQVFRNGVAQLEEGRSNS